MHCRSYDTDAPGANVARRGQLTHRTRRKAVLAEQGSSDILACVDREGNDRRLFLTARCVRDVDEHFERRPSEFRNLVGKNNVDPTKS